MKPIIKWPGNKEKELNIIINNLPESYDRLIEPFVGGGSVFLGINSNKNVINDKSKELYEFYRCIKDDKTLFYEQLQEIYDNFKKIHEELIVKEDVLKLSYDEMSIKKYINKNISILCIIGNLNSKLFIAEVEKSLKHKMEYIRKSNDKGLVLDEVDRCNIIETAIKSAYYVMIRYFYNNSKNYTITFRAAVFFFIREYCYSSMFRYNAKGEFNVPYGGMSYNRKDEQKKINMLKTNELHSILKSTEIYNMDYKDFLNFIKLKETDFIFLDPPYDSDFSTYSNNSFSLENQKELKEYLENINAKFMLIIKYTDYIYNLYKNSDFNIRCFDKKYTVNIKNRNKKDVTHLLICNY